MLRSNSVRRAACKVALVMALLAGLGALVTGCSQAAADPKRAQIETVAAFFVAGSNGDKAAAQALVTDPNSAVVAGISEPGETQASWKWDGDSATVDAGAVQLTVTASASTPGSVVVEDANGVSLTVVLKLVDGKWKIDTAALAAASTTASAEAQQMSCFANQRTIEGAVQTALASGDAQAASVSDLVPEFIKSEPTCPTTGLSYVLLSSGAVEPCSAHGHY